MKNLNWLKNRWVVLTILAILVAVLLSILGLWDRKVQAGDYITALVDRGTLRVTVSATGTLQAVTTVQVGSQVSGTVASLGADFNSRVKKGQVIARLDPAIFQSQVENARANVTNAQAAIQAATVEIGNQRANLTAARANQQVVKIQRDDAAALVKRYQELKDLVSSRDLEAAQAQANAAIGRYEQAAAQVVQAQSAIATAQAKSEQTKASLEQAKAQLQQALVNLNHTIITSPIEGIVVSRNVDIGQTVAASLQAPTLFVIADDLTKMQVLASIDEADVGQVREGIRATFTVDAFPGETFSGKVSQMRLGAQTLQNVVTYTAVIEVENPELKLRPGMTANIILPVAQRDNVLMIPNAALRFHPTLTEKEEEQLRAKTAGAGQGTAGETQRAPGNQQQREQQGGQAASSARSSGDGGARRNQSADRPAGGRGGRSGERQRQTIWVLAPGDKLQARLIRTGITNGRNTEILSGELRQGEAVVIGQNEVGAARQQPTASPLGQRPSGFGGSGGFGSGGRRQ
ncbi:MAG TPA: efflux RND transporter periplasmic adaptor subunit [Acidobacteriota bacterium]